MGRGKARTQHDGEGEGEGMCWTMREDEATLLNGDGEGTDSAGGGVRTIGVSGKGSKQTRSQRDVERDAGHRVGRG
jgi:hypothetical protein